MRSRTQLMTALMRGEEDNENLREELMTYYYFNYTVEKDGSRVWNIRDPLAVRELARYGLAH